MQGARGSALHDHANRKKSVNPALNDSPRPNFDLPEYQENRSGEKSSGRDNPNHYDGKTIAKHTGLFLATVATVALTGASFVGFNVSLFPLVMPALGDFLRGLLFAGLLLSFLGVHEFGHFFAAMRHRVKVTLPYFIPVPLGIGTFGAVIRIKEKIDDTRKLFDVGVAGPMAGLVVSLAILLYGFATLPDPSYIQNFEGHEAVKNYVAQHGTYPEQPPEGAGQQQDGEGQVLMLGNTLLYGFLAGFFENVPPMYEMYHYPFLFAGWLGLFFTALNLMPVGQLDGGHILYSLIGFRKHREVARYCFAGVTALAGIEAIPFIHTSLGDWDTAMGSMSWLIWAVILFLLLRRAFHGDLRWIMPILTLSLLATAAWLYGMVGHLETNSSLIWVFWSGFIAWFVGIEHPPSRYERRLSAGRRRLGWFSMVVFLLCISPNPLYFV